MPAADYSERLYKMDFFTFDGQIFSSSDEFTRNPD